MAELSKAQYGSDVVIDMIQTLGIEYIALNPGASYRGIHDSLVNYAGGKPELILCNHEGIAVAVAHGYANASGKSMIAAVHDVVGLLNATERVYNAWLDQVPIIVIGGTGPVAADLRRPHGDWIHTALVQGEGPVTTAAELRPALERALAVVLDGKPALVDVVTR